MTVESGALVINDVEASDAGNYVCTASNYIGAATSVSNLVVLCEYLVQDARQAANGRCSFFF